MDTLAGAVQNSHSLMAETTQADDVQTRSPLFELPPRSQLGVAAPAESLQVAHGPADRSRREERAKTRKARRQKRWEELEIEEAYSDPELQDPDNVEELAAAEEAEAEAELDTLLRSDAGFEGSEQRWQQLGSESCSCNWLLRPTLGDGKVS